MSVDVYVALRYGFPVESIDHRKIDYDALCELTDDEGREYFEEHVKEEVGGNWPPDNQHEWLSEFRFAGCGIAQPADYDYFLYAFTTESLNAMRNQYNLVKLPDDPEMHVGVGIVPPGANERLTQFTKALGIGKPKHVGWYLTGEVSA